MYRFLCGHNFFWIYQRTLSVSLNLGKLCTSPKAVLAFSSEDYPSIKTILRLYDVMSPLLPSSFLLSFYCSQSTQLIHLSATFFFLKWQFLKTLLCVYVFCVYICVSVNVCRLAYMVTHHCDYHALEQKSISGFGVLIF